MPIDMPRMKERKTRILKTLTLGMAKKIQEEMASDRMIDRLYPRRPEKIPDRKTAQAYPNDEKAKRLLALAWLIANSSSMRGIIGAKIALPEKLINQRDQKKIMNSKAFPLRPENFSIAINLLSFSAGIQCIIENKS